MLVSIDFNELRSIHLDAKLDLLILKLNILVWKIYIYSRVIKISKEIAKTGFLYELFIDVLFDQLNVIRLEILY